MSKQRKLIIAGNWKTNKPSAARTMPPVGRLRRATEAARADLLASDWNRKAVITTLVSDVATAYFNLLELDMELDIAKNTLATREESLRVKIEF